MLETIMSNADVILSTITGIITIASIVIAGTKTPDPDTVLGKIYKAVEFLSLTIGKAKETGKPEVKPEEVKVAESKTEVIKEE
tara:strand:- start:786 stop:1034 length:249 start_codon:yes stop_codon:yes gene_type:complete